MRGESCKDSLLGVRGPGCHPGSAATLCGILGKSLPLSGPPFLHLLIQNFSASALMTLGQILLVMGAALCHVELLAASLVTSQ